MDVWVWPADWGLASIDSQCLQMLAYAKFSGAPLKGKQSGNPFWTPKGNLPVFTHHGVTLADFAPFVAHLRLHKYSADYNLTPKQCAEVAALGQLMQERLHPALLYVLWLDAKNMVEFTRPWFSQHMPFPLNMYYPSKFRQNAADVVESRFNVAYIEGELQNISLLETAVYKGAVECLSMLSLRLGNNPYLFGQAPTSADALLYGYLAPLVKAPFPNPTLQNHVLACDNLVKFVGRISQNYFAKSCLDYEKPVSNDETHYKNDEKSETVSDPGETTRNIAAGCVAASAMIGYAYTSGLIAAVRNTQMSNVAGLSHVQRVRLLYKTCLKLHKGLPTHMQMLGDAYVKDEFKRHKTATPEQAQIFMEAWAKYAMTVSKQIGVKGMKRGSSSVLGDAFKPEDFDMFTSEQLVQLYELYQESSKPPQQDYKS